MPSTGKAAIMGDGLLALLSAVFLVVAVWFVARDLRRIPRAWHGEMVPGLPRHGYRMPEVTHRSFVAAALWEVFFLASVLMALTGALAGVPALAEVGVTGILLAMVVLLPLWIVVNAVNRPRFLVPPSRRDELGWVQERRRRKARRRAGDAETEHHVELLDVRPPPEEKRPYDPYWVAVCQERDCTWMGGPVGQDAEHPDPESALRVEAAQHSSYVTGPVRPLG